MALLFMGSSVDNLERLHYFYGHLSIVLDGPLFIGNLWIAVGDFSIYKVVDSLRWPQYLRAYLWIVLTLYLWGSYGHI